MSNRFTDVMAGRSDDELLRVINEDRKEYQREAVQAAENELAKRGLSVEQTEDARTRIRQRAGRANEELGAGWKALAFLFPGLLNLVFVRRLVTDGYDRKASDVTRWTVYGVVYYVVMLILIRVLT